MHGATIKITDESCSNSLPKCSKSRWWYIRCVCVQWMCWRIITGKFKDSKNKHTEFTVSFNTNPSQGRRIRADFISSVLKEKWVSHNLIRLIGTQTDKWQQELMTLTSGIQCNLCSVPFSNVQRILRLYLLKWIRGFNHGRNWAKTMEGGKIDHGLLCCIYSASRKTQGSIFSVFTTPK